jgi:NAD(P)-dependent dehydrogenase (short-subunit alcohol dehydrogenase family)
MAILNGKVAIIVGAGRGIGASSARTLASAGAAVVLASRTASQVSEVSERIRQAGGTAEAIPTDVTKVKQVETLVQRTLDAFGRIDILINCAAIVGPAGQLAWEADPEAWRQTIEIDLFGSFLTCRAVIPQMIWQGSGRLLNVSSATAEAIVNRHSAYASAKAAVNHFTRVLAAELIGTGVTANVVYPGLAQTQALQEFRSKMFGGDRTALEPYQWLMRSQDPSEPAALLLWLCSPATARMSGQIIKLNDLLVQRRLTAFLYRQAAGLGFRNDTITSRGGL